MKTTPNQLIVLVAIVAIVAVTVVACVLGADAGTLIGGFFLTLIAIVAAKLFAGGGNANPPSPGDRP